MTEYIQKKFLKMKLLTPVHISDGCEVELTPTEYLLSDDGQLHRIDLAKVIGHLPEDSLSEINKYLVTENLHGLRNFIKSLWQTERNILEDCLEYSMDAVDLADYYHTMENENTESRFIVVPFVRTGNKIFIPGSSIKGAIRTAFITGLLKTPIAYDLEIAKKEIDRQALKLEQDTLNYGYIDRYGKHKPNIIKDPFKALKIADSSTTLNSSSVKKVVIAMKDNSGQFQCTETIDMKIFAEFLMEGNEIDIEARLDTRYFGNQRSIGKDISFELMRNFCKIFYDKVLKHEKDVFFRGFDETIGNSKISQLYDEFLKLNEHPSGFLLRVGKHIGRNSISFNLINKNGIEPKSRKLIVKDGQYWPLGWVFVTESN
jgi:CRISPR-associated protein Csm5